MWPVAVYSNSSFLPICSFSLLFGTLFFWALALLLSWCNNEKYSQERVLSSYLCYAMNLYSLSRSDGLLKLHWNEQIDVNFRQVIYFSSEFYTVPRYTLTRAGQNEWKSCQWWLLPFFKDFDFSEGFFLLFFWWFWGVVLSEVFLIGKQYRSAPTFKGKRIKKKKK